MVTVARRFFVHRPPLDPKTLGVICCGREECAADYHLQRTHFPYVGIEFVASGEGLLRLNGTEHRLTAGVLFAYDAGVPHEIISDPKHLLVKYFVDLAGREVNRLLTEPRPGEAIQTSAPEQVLHLFDDLIDAGLRKSSVQQKICSIIVQHLLLKIADTAVPMGPGHSEAFETYERCHRYIEMHYREVTALPEIARACEVDPAYVCRLFKRFDKRGPWQFVIVLRMQDAAERLQRPGALIKRVSKEMGFGDPFQFSRTFRRVYGVSPRRFMQLQRMKAEGDEEAQRGPS